jgi:hypothetical protein
MNIARLVAPDGDPRVAEFMDGLDPVNAVADASPGFVWRLTGEGNSATDLRPFGPDVIVNMSVWETPEHLRAFFRDPLHRSFFSRRSEWFVPMDGPHVVLWWVPVGHEPTPEEGRERLDHLAAHGPTPHAFTLGTVVDATAGAEHGGTAGAPVTSDAPCG